VSSGCARAAGTTQTTDSTPANVRPDTHRISAARRAINQSKITDMREF
jgi:hypothetical protein